MGIHRHGADGADKLGARICPRPNAEAAAGIDERGGGDKGSCRFLAIDEQMEFLLRGIPGGDNVLPDAGGQRGVYRDRAARERIDHVKRAAGIDVNVERLGGAPAALGDAGVVVVIRGVIDPEFDGQSGAPGIAPKQEGAGGVVGILARSQSHGGEQGGTAGLGERGRSMDFEAVGIARGISEKDGGRAGVVPLPEPQGRIGENGGVVGVAHQESPLQIRSAHPRRDR